MDQNEFFDKLLQMYYNTTNAEDRFWDYQEQHGLFNVVSVGSDDGASIDVASGLFENDADWITAVHGAFPELCKMFWAASDQADRADQNADSRECRIAELEVEVAELKADLEGLLG
jgi:hypothetical protein